MTAKAQTNTHSADYIMLVDDNHLHLEYISRVFEDEKFRIITANSAEQAQNLLKHRMVDIILLDIVMPGKNGFEFCQEIRKNTRTADLPVIFLTSKTDKESIIKGFEVGGNDYITIPFNPEELKARVKTQLQIIRQRDRLKELNTELDQVVRERTQQLEDANKLLQNIERTKADYLTLLSYKIRTPLNTIMGFSQILEGQVKDKQQMRNLQMIKGASEKLRQIAETALLISSLSGERTQAHFNPVDVRDIIRIVIDDYTEELNQRNIILRTNLKKQHISGDGELLKIALLNIIENALKYSPKNSTLDIKLYKEADNLIFVCNDEGPGFSDDALLTLNELEINAPSKPLQAHDFGLGLITVKLITDIHEGFVQFNNQENSGAQVKLIIPLFSEE